ncbi:MAG TPA: TrkA family potassium uptake protein [Acidimicrobiales bacterium]|nr:TrkA family potassium uptake protein [Acidimicrobiales bacterium]
MHVVVIGCGRVGSGLAVEFTRAGHSVGIIDKNPRSFRRLAADWPGERIVGFGFDRDHLEEAGARRATGLAAVTSGDNSNILCARIARETYEIPNVVARIYDPRRAEIFQRLGIPTVPTVAWTIDHVLRRMMPERAVTEWSDSTGRLHLIERPLPASWEGRRLPAAALRGGGIRVAAVSRAGTPTVDVEDLVGQEGDVLHLIVTEGAEGRLEALFPGVTIVPGFRDGGNRG